MSSTYETPNAQVPYYLPLQPEVLGKAIEPQPDNKPIPKLFQPLSIKNVTFPNRIGVSPMCQYLAGSISKDGKPENTFLATPYHFAHYGGFTTRGAGLTIVEAAAVSAEGALSQKDLGIFNDEQAEKLKEIVDYAHGNQAKIGIQIGHGGRKANGQPIFIHLEQTIDKSIGGWGDKIVAPSAIEFRPKGNYPVPNELSREEIKRIIKDFGLAAKRAIEISGFDFIEIHGAHGYLITEFYSAISNKRKDEYGGSFENRIRFLIEIIKEVKFQIGDKIPIFLRISAVDNDDTTNDAWTIDDSIKLAHIVAQEGVDLLDISSGGNSHNQARRGTKSFVHHEYAKAIKKSVGDKLIVACVGAINDANKANQAIEDGDFDLALVGKGFLQNPGLAWTWADQLGVRVHQSLQYDWGFHPKISQIVELIERSKQ